eukprot:gene6444-7725_t
MQNADSLKVVVNSNGEILEIVNSFHQSCLWEPVELVDHNVTTRFIEMPSKRPDIDIVAGYFARSHDIDDTVYVVEFFEGNIMQSRGDRGSWFSKNMLETRGDIVVHIVLCHAQREDIVDQLLPHLIPGTNLIVQSVYPRCLCGTYALPRNADVRRFVDWIRGPSLRGRLLDGYSVVRLPDGVDSWTRTAREADWSILRRTSDHVMRGVCRDDEAIRGLEQYAYDPLDHMGFLVRNTERATLENVTVENGGARMTRHQDFCALYRCSTTNACFLVVYMRIPDYLEDQLFHLLLDNHHRRSCEEWALSEEISEAVRYAQVCRTAVLTHCLLRLLSDCHNVSDTMQAGKLAQSVTHVTFNCFAVERLICGIEGRIENSACFHRDASSLARSEGNCVCEIDEDSSSHPKAPEGVPNVLAIVIGAHRLRTRCAARIANATPRNLPTEKSFQNVLYLAGRDIDLQPNYVRASHEATL